MSEGTVPAKGGEQIPAAQKKTDGKNVMGRSKDNEGSDCVHFLKRTHPLDHQNTN